MPPYLPLLSFLGRVKAHFKCQPNSSTADVKMEIPVLVQSQKPSILSSTSLQMGKTAAVEQSRRKANMIARGDGKFDPKGNLVVR